MKILKILLATLTAATIAILIISFGSRQFGGFDQSIFINVGYRLYEGQIPYQDFYVTAPLLFFLGSGWAFQLFGVSFSAFPAIAALYAALSFLLLYYILLRLKLHFGWALGLSMVVELASMVSVAYWWYNPITAVAACLFLSASLLLLREPEKITSLVIFTATLLLLALAKPNVAGPLILFSVFILGTGKKTFRPFWIGSFFSFLLFMMLLSKYQINLTEVIASYASSSSRGKPSMARFIQDQSPTLVLLWKRLIALMLSLVFLRLAYFVFYRSAKQLVKELFRRDVFLLFGSVLTAFIAFFTNGEPKLTDFPQLFLPCALFSLMPMSNDVPKNRISQSSSYLLAGVIFILSYVSLDLGYRRLRVELVGPGTFYQGPPEILVGSKNHFFKNLWTGPIMISTLNEIQSEIDDQKRRTPNRLKVFFGPRMEFGYAAFDQSPPKGEPIFWWDNGVSFPEMALETIVKRFQEDNFTLCIFRYEDFIHIPQGIRKILDQEFIKKQTENLTVFYKNQSL